MKCAYCGAPAVHVDHVVSKNDRRRYGIAKSDERYQVPACFACNITKMARRLAPTPELVDELNALMSGPGVADRRVDRSAHHGG